MSLIRKGDEVTVTVRGKVLDTYSYDGCVHIEDPDGYSHYIYIATYPSSKSVKVTVEENFAIDDIVRSDSGGVFRLVWDNKREERRWQMFGSSTTLGYSSPTRPLTKLGEVK